MSNDILTLDNDDRVVKRQFVGGSDEYVYTYYASGERHTETYREHEGKPYELFYLYDKKGNTLLHITENGGIYTWEYDSMDNMVKSNYIRN